MAKGWAGWAQQAAELHTFRADHVNRTKSGTGFFKLSNESIAAVREDLATDYQALADRHSEEVAQILEEYGAAELEIAHQVQNNEADRLATGKQTIETVQLPDSPQEDAGPKPQEAPVAATLAPPISGPTMEENLDSGPIVMPSTTDAATPLPTTSASPPQTEPCTAATREPPAQPELTSEPATTPVVEPTPELETSEPLHTNETAGEVVIESATPDLPPVTTPPTDPTPPESSILDIFDDA